MHGQTSGSISIDTTGLAGEIMRAIGPVMTQINDNMTLLAGLLASTALDEDDAVNVLVENLPHRTWSLSHPTALDVAGHLAEHLAQAGYALVAINGPALEAEVARSGIETSLPLDLQEIVVPGATHAALEDAWFEPGRED